MPPSHLMRSCNLPLKLNSYCSASSMLPLHSLYLPICHFPVRQSVRNSVWKPSPLEKRFNNASSDSVILSYAVQLDLEWIEFRWMHFKWFEFWQLQFMWFEFKQCSWKVVQILAMWIQVRVVLPSDPQVGGHTSWLSGHCPLLGLTCKQATVPAEAFPPVLAACVTSGQGTLAGTGHGQSGASLWKTSLSSFTIRW